MLSAISNIETFAEFSKSSSTTFSVIFSCLSVFSHSGLMEIWRRCIYFVSWLIRPRLFWPLCRTKSGHSRRMPARVKTQWWGKTPVWRNSLEMFSIECLNRILTKRIKSRLADYSEYYEMPTTTKMYTNVLRHSWVPGETCMVLLAKFSLTLKHETTRSRSKNLPNVKPL